MPTGRLADSPHLKHPALTPPHGHTIIKAVADTPGCYLWPCRLANLILADE